jgi:hypothetical protein
MVESKTRIIQDDPNFWIDKPTQKGHPKYKEKTENTQKTRKTRLFTEYLIDYDGEYLETVQAINKKGVKAYIKRRYTTRTVFSGGFFHSEKYMLGLFKITRKT